MRLWSAVCSLLFAWPTLRMLQVAGRRLGRLAWLFASRSREVTRRNIALCFPELSFLAREQLARESVVATAQLALESAAVWSRDPGALDDWVVHVDGKAEFDAALSEGRGVLCLVPHLGNWEVLNAWLGRHYPFTAMYAPRENRWLEAWIRSSRERSGSQLVPTNHAGVRALLEALQQRRVVGLMPDQVPDDGAGVRTTFFGNPALTGTLAARIAMRRESPAFLVCAVRDGSRHGFVISYRKVELPPRAADVQAVLTAIGTQVERAVLCHAAQYQWEYKRFKHATPGVDVYKQDR